MRKLQPKGINYIYRLRAEKKVDGKKRKRLLLSLPILAILLAAVAIFVFYTIKIVDAGAQLAAVESRLALEDESGINASLESASAAQAVLQSRCDELSALLGASESYPRPEQQIINGIKSLCGDDINILSASYSADSGVFTFECTAPSAMGAPVFIRRVVASGLFANVEYYGYAGEPGDVYSFTAICAVSPPDNASETTDTAASDTTAADAAESDTAATEGGDGQ